MARRESVTAGWRTTVDGWPLELPAGTTTAVVAGPDDDPLVLARLLSGECGPDARTRLVCGDTELAAHRAVFGNVVAPLRRFGADLAWCGKTVIRLLDLVGLASRANWLPERLTPGERRRAALALALAHGPDVLVAADPFAGLDDCGAAGVLAALDRIRAELGMTVLVVTPDARLAGRVADRVALRGHDGAAPVCEPVLAALATPGSPVAEALLPPLGPLSSAPPTHSRVVDAVLIGHAALAAVAETPTLIRLGGTTTKFGETPVAHYRFALRDGAPLTPLTQYAAHLHVLTPAVRLAA